jgi:hypothetical protein
MLAEINRLRRDPAKYARSMIEPLKERLVRVPEDKAAPFEGWKAFLNPADPLDYILLDEGGTEQSARVILDETLAALRAAPPVQAVTRNAPLDQAARYFSRDVLRGGKDRAPHMDSLGRRPAQRIAAFGLTRKAREDWERFLGQGNDRSEATLRVYQEEGIYYRLQLRDQYRYTSWSVPEVFARFVIERGREATLPLIDKPGHECVVRVDPKTRLLHCGEASIAYPLALPAHAENVVWGPWSRAWAARGLVCWWVLDPGVEGRGHRRNLLDADFAYCGLGCVWSRPIGWVATWDATAEPLEEPAAAKTPPPSS